MCKTTDWLIRGISLRRLEKEKIKVLKGEIKWLEKQNDALRKDYTRACAERDARIATHDFIKTKAYKECVEKVKEIAQSETYCDNRFPKPIIIYHIKEDDLNNLLKELEGEN